MIDPLLESLQQKDERPVDAAINDLSYWDMAGVLPPIMTESMMLANSIIQILDKYRFSDEQLEAVRRVLAVTKMEADMPLGENFFYIQREEQIEELNQEFLADIITEEEYLGKLAALMDESASKISSEQ